MTQMRGRGRGMGWVNLVSARWTLAAGVPSSCRTVCLLTDGAGRPAFLRTCTVLMLRGLNPMPAT